MSIYVDANILVALFIPDVLTSKAGAAVARLADPLIVSDLTALEFASTVARKMREGILSSRDAREVLANFDAWTGSAVGAELRPFDVATAGAILRRLDINLHGMDALHVALATRLGAALLTLDAKMKASAKKLGLAVV